MFIRKFLMFIFLMFFSFSLVFIGLGEGGEAISREKMRQAERDIQRVFPNFRVASMIRVPIDELYVVVADDGAVIFYSPSGYIMLGDIMNLRGESFLAKVYDEALARVLDDRDGRFFVKVSDGEYKVIAFLSLTNGESRKVYSFLKERKNIDFNVFPLVRSEEDRRLGIYVYCAGDRRKALDDVMNGRVKASDVRVSGACEKRAQNALEVNLKVASAVMAYDAVSVFIGDKRIYGYQPFEIMKALYFLGWREEDGRKGAK
jgi:hypothetical protein